MDYAQYFTQRELQKIHDASLEILENIGILVIMKGPEHL